MKISIVKHLQEFHPASISFFFISHRFSPVSFAKHLFDLVLVFRLNVLATIEPLTTNLSFVNLPAVIEPPITKLSFRAERADFSLPLCSCKGSARVVEESLFDVSVFQRKISLSKQISVIPPFCALTQPS